MKLVIPSEPLLFGAMCHLALPAVPSPPTNLTISEATPTSLSIEWGPPLQPNGVILWYEVRYVGLDTFNLVSPSFYNESVIRVNRSSPKVELVELVPYSLYNITVQAATQVGSSDSAVLTARTNESCKFTVYSVPDSYQMQTRRMLSSVYLLRLNPTVSFSDCLCSNS